MKIAIVYDSAHYPTPVDFRDARADTSRFLREHYDVTFMGTSLATLHDDLCDIAQKNVDSVVNLCPISPPDRSLGRMVQQALKSLALPFTGADCQTGLLHGSALRMVAHSAGLAIPRFTIIDTLEDLDTRVGFLDAPFRVTSLPRLDTMPGASVSANNGKVLTERIAHLLRPGINTLLVEETKTGRIFDVAVVGKWGKERVAKALLPHEYSNAIDAQSSLTKSAHVDDLAIARLQEAAVTLFQAIPESGYLLCKLQLGEQGDVSLLDVSFNADIFKTESNDQGSIWDNCQRPVDDMCGVLVGQIELAVERHRKTKNAYEVRFDPTHGFGLHAAIDISEGVVVVPGESLSLRLISNAVVEHEWTQANRDVFNRYCWPVNAGVSAYWSDNPADWKPLNHSCDPNTVLTGLDQVARRNITRGEAITLDYATFCGPTMTPFTCLCATPSCRVTVTGTDYRLASLQDTYRDHFSAHLRALIKAETDHNPFSIRRTRYGGGLIAGKAWHKDDILAQLNWTDAVDAPTRWTVQLGPRKHAELLPPILSWSNHSCDPNIAMDIGANVVRALRDIANGDDLVWFYPSTEWKMIESFQCECGTKSCLGLIDGAETLAAEVLSRYRLSPNVEAHIRAREKDTVEELV
ncbi:SET domain-containing protein-lysine N-methyltransferase [Robbsia sp. KACC 23696]|uniref:SET domain-containing protein-lysine N-methyltransferase n=1 Tax=Robbsia sp. KACC 23696 TaxID=3149231 RepID=UPI00325B55C8